MQQLVKRGCFPANCVRSQLRLGCAVLYCKAPLLGSLTLLLALCLCMLSLLLAQLGRRLPLLLLFLP